jgi:NADH-quinone oxidoreductase subunit J
MILIGAEFIAMLLVIVYVGAVAVLFLFVVMMLDIDFASCGPGSSRTSRSACAGFGAPRRTGDGRGRLKAGALVLGVPGGPRPAGLSNTAAIGALLYSRYLFLFEAAGIILLVAMIGAIVLTHRQRGDVRGQNISKQVARRPEEATINLKPEVGQGVEL